MIYVNMFRLSRKEMKRCKPIKPIQSIDELSNDLVFNDLVATGVKVEISTVL